MSVWLAVPSKRPTDEAERCLGKWRGQGYRLAIFADGKGAQSPKCNLRIWQPTYPGYAVAVNELCQYILERDSQAEWIVAAGDDTLPDPNHSAEEIARTCCWHFSLEAYKSGDPHVVANTFGVMQPTGDPWADSHGRIIERIAGSPWIGREFARRMYGGAGPYWYEYRHCFVDEELQCVAQKLGVFWQRPDLTHMHHNWARAHAGRPQDMPDFLRDANSPEHWAKYSAIFKERKSAGFPGHEPIA